MAEARVLFSGQGGSILFGGGSVLNDGGSWRPQIPSLGKADSGPTGFAFFMRNTGGSQDLKWILNKTTQGEFQKTVKT